MVVQSIRNRQAVGSIPTAGSSFQALPIFFPTWIYPNLPSLLQQNLQQIFPLFSAFPVGDPVDQLTRGPDRFRYGALFHALANHGPDPGGFRGCFLETGGEIRFGRPKPEKNPADRPRRWGNVSQGSPHVFYRRFPIGHRESLFDPFEHMGGVFFETTGQIFSGGRPEPADIPGKNPLVRTGESEPGMAENLRAWLRREHLCRNFVPGIKTV